MTDTLLRERAVPHWSFWLIAGIGLLYNGYGGYDYTMTRTRNVDYLNSMGGAKDILAWIDAFPMWAQVLWPVGVWASVLGAVLLLLRSRHAVTAFLVSLIGAIGSFAAQMTVAAPASLDTTANKVMPLVILSGIGFFWWYSRRQVAAGVLR
jgi:hypothetical protein